MSSCAFLFTVQASAMFSRPEESVMSARSMSLVSRPEGTPAYVVRDPEFTPDDVAGRIAGILSAEKVVDVSGSAISAKNYGNYVMSMLRMAIDGLRTHRFDPDVILSVPSCWMCVSGVSVENAVRVARFHDNVLSVFLGGCPLAHVDDGASFNMCLSPFKGYLKLRSNSWDYPALDRTACPSVLNVARFNELCKAKEQSINAISRCGWDDKCMVLYPDSLTSRPGDGKPEPFVDIVGIEPEHWERHVEKQ